jgi:hypothetical protein
MNNYLDQLDIKHHPLTIQLTLSGVVDNGVPGTVVRINNKVQYSGAVDDTITVCSTVPLLAPISVAITLDNKIYSDRSETAIVIESLTIDGVDMVPRYTDCISYCNDQQKPIQAFYLGYNGVWSFNINEPFYRWWHRASGQGWLLEPAPLC